LVNIAHRYERRIFIFILQMETDAYLTIKSPSEGLYKEKGSRFISYAFPVTTQEDIKTHLETIRKQHHAARHHCYAWMLGCSRENFRANDDGEPSGSAGKPILGQINSFNLTNVLIVVVRYFGGKLLGVPGLINAYRTAAESAIRNSEIIRSVELEHFEIEFPYSSLNDVMKILKDEDVDHAKQKFEMVCSITVNVRPSETERIKGLFSRIVGLKILPSGEGGK